MVEGDGTDAAGQAAAMMSASAADFPVAVSTAGPTTLSRKLGQLLKNKPAVAMVALPASLLLASAILSLFLSDTANKPPAVTVTIEGATSYHELPEFLADLRSSRTRMHYVQLAAVVEVPEDGLAQLQAQQTHIIAGVQMALRDLRKQDLAGAAGVERLRSVLASIVDHHIAPASVTSVLFTKFLVD
jgi:flagellar basal body-associated protein FliL